MHRRGFFCWARDGLASAAAASLMLKDGTLRLHVGVPGEADDLPPHLPARATRAIHICLVGALSQVDSFDYKPELIKNHGKSLQSSERPDVFFGQVGLLRAPDWQFRQRGQSGLWVSDLFPHIAEQADDLTIIRSMVAETSNHTPATFQENSGFRLNGFPSLGAWLSYGLGSEADDLPAFVVIPDVREMPPGGPINWSSGFLPARHQGTIIRPSADPIADLFPARPIDPGAERAAHALVKSFNERHLEQHAGEDTLTARIKGYQLAARMQNSVPHVADLAGETAETQALYGLDRPETQDFARACILGRRLLERGVRFVQLYSGGTFGSPRRNWDGHENMKQNHGQEALRIDQPVAALLRDLKRRGMLEDTLVLCTTEFGRTPFAQSAADAVGLGRDHNQTGFTVWMAGAGLKPGMAYGSTDEVGWKASDQVVTWPDFHATVLRLLGIDHERLTFYHNGIRRRLTNVHGRPVDAILA